MVARLPLRARDDLRRPLVVTLAVAAVLSFLAIFMVLLGYHSCGNGGEPSGVCEPQRRDRAVWLFVAAGVTATAAITGQLRRRHYAPPGLLRAVLTTLGVVALWSLSLLGVYAAGTGTNRNCEQVEGLQQICADQSRELRQRVLIAGVAITAVTILTRLRRPGSASLSLLALMTAAVAVPALWLVALVAAS